MEVVLNWFAQGAVLAAATAAGLRVIPFSRAQARYGFVWAAYLLLLVLPAVAPVQSLAIDGSSVDRVPASAAPLVTVPAAWWTSPTTMIGLWIVWVIVHAVQLGLDAAAVYRAKRRGHECPRDVLARLRHWSQVSATGRAARVLLSNDVHAAGVLGGGAPVIAIAPGLVAHLSPADLDRVLIHEWAHVQRCDDRAQFLQRLLRIIVGWHPAAWWLERQLDFEREVACDEIVVSVTRSAKEYAGCLATLAALPRRERSVPVLAAVAPSRLHRRVMRILAAPAAAAARPWRALSIASGVGLIACASAIGNVHVAASAAWTAVPSTRTPQTVAVRLNVPAVAESREPAAPIVTSPASSARRLRGTVTPAARENGAAHDVGGAHAIEAASAPAIASMSVPLADWPPNTGPSVAVAEHAVEPRADVDREPSAPSLTPQPPDVSAGWMRTADAGVAIGRVSRVAGLATAGFFNRFGKKVANSFEVSSARTSRQSE